MEGAPLGLLAHKGHIVAVALALLIYVIRGLMMLSGSSSVNSRLMLALSTIFTILIFVGGVYMGFTKHLPFVDGYMLTMIISFLLFVVFGVISLKRGLSKPVAILFWLIGLAAFIYTALIATHKLAPLF
jgi:uncharacterized membrane protein SirB2